jgi:hypothetical protein
VLALSQSLLWLDGVVGRGSRFSRCGGRNVVGSEAELREANSSMTGRRGVATGEGGAPVILCEGGRDWGTLWKCGVRHRAVPMRGSGA